MNPKLIGLIFLILGIVALVFGFGEIGGVIPGLGEQKYDLACNVQIGNALISKASIKGVTCNWQKSSSLFSLWDSYKDLISDSGTIQIQAQSKTTSLSYEVSELGSETKTLWLKSLNPGQTRVSVKLFDKNLVEIDSETVNVNIGG